MVLVVFAVLLTIGNAQLPSHKRVSNAEENSKVKWSLKKRTLL